MLLQVASLVELCISPNADIRMNMFGFNQLQQLNDFRRGKSWHAQVMVVALGLRKTAVEIVFLFKIIDIFAKAAYQNDMCFINRNMQTLFTFFMRHAVIINADSKRHRFWENMTLW